jgi:hypothetical protein
MASTRSARPAFPGCQQRERRMAELEDELQRLRQQLDQTQRDTHRQAHPFRRPEASDKARKPGRRDELTPTGYGRRVQEIENRLDDWLAANLRQPPLSAELNRLDDHVRAHRDEWLVFLIPVDATVFWGPAAPDPREASAPHFEHIRAHSCSWQKVRAG